MKHMILLRMCPLLFTINLSLCYNIPHADFIIYPKGFSISIPDEQGIEIFFFYGSVNKVTCNFNTNSVIMSTSKSNGEKWIVENTDISLAPGHIIYYWLYVKKDGIDYTKHDNFYNVTDILPYNTRFEEPNTVYSQTSEVTTKTRLNLDPYHLRPSSNFVTPSIVAKLPSGNILPFTQKLHPHLNPTKQPVSKKPSLNFYHNQHPHDTTTPLNLDPVKKPFLQHPLNLDPASAKTEKPVLNGIKQQVHYVNNNLTTLEFNTNRNCSDTGYEHLPLPLETNQSTSKEVDEKCIPSPTSSKFNPYSPPVVNQHHLQNKWKGQIPTQSTTQRPNSHLMGEIWYWNRK